MKKLTEQDIFEIKRLRNEGVPIAQISIKFNVSRQYIYSIIDEAPIKRKQNKTYTNKFKLKVVKYYKNNRVSYSATARHFNLNVSVVKYWIRKYEEDEFMKQKTDKTYFRTKKHAKEIAELEDKDARILELEEKLYEKELEVEYLKKKYPHLVTLRKK